MPRFDIEIWNKILDEISVSTNGIHTICKRHKTTAKYFYIYLRGGEDDEEQTQRRNQYARAREDQADYLADLIQEVAFDDSDDEKPFVGVNHIQRDRLKIDSLKWVASKLKPKKFGDKIDVTSDGNELKTQVITGMVINNTEKKEDE